jgi:hypothetical protein
MFVLLFDLFSTGDGQRDICLTAWTGQRNYCASPG